MEKQTQLPKSDLSVAIFRGKGKHKPVAVDTTKGEAIVYGMTTDEALAALRESGREVVWNG